MNRGRSFLILLVVALGIGAYIYFVEAKREPASDSAIPKRTKVFTVDTNKIEALDVHSQTGDTTTLKKNNGTWQITSPAGLDTDEGAVDSLVTTIGSLESSRVLDDKPTPDSLKEYQLAPPRFSVSFRLAGDTTTHTFAAGIKTPTGSDMYSQIDGKPAVLLVGAYQEDAIDKSTFDLRDKTVLKFTRDGADLLQLVGGPKPLSFEKKGADWRMTAPIDARADFSAVDGIIGRLFQARMKSLVTPDGMGDLKKYGLDKPQATATVGVGSTRASLAIGAKAPDGSLYARDLSRPMIFTVESTMLDDLKHKADDLRLKDLFAFRTFSADEVDITQAGKTWTLTKQKGTGANAADVWKLTKPEAKDVDQTKATDLLTALSNLRADSFVDAAAGGDEIVVTARYGDPASPTEEHVTFHVSKGKSGEVVQAVRQGDTGAAVVPSADFDKALQLFKDLTGAK